MIQAVFPINNLSYGIVGLNLIVELSKLDDVLLWPIGNISVNTKKEDIGIIQKAIDNVKFFNRKEKSIRLFHQFSLDLFPSDIRIGFPIFELNRFNDVELNNLRSLDYIFVCTKWAQQILKDSNIDIPSYIISLGVNQDIFKPVKTQDWNTTRFLYPGKWEVRKSHDCFSEIFNDAFEIDDKVELFLMSENPFLSKEEAAEWQKLYKDSKLGEKIHFIPYQQQPQQVNLIYNSADCIVSLSRAEGWNLPLLEGLACGKAVIATNYSGHTEFLTEENSYLIEVDELETAYDGKWFYGQGEWGMIGDGQKEQAIDYMRRFHKLRQEGKDLVNTNGLDTAREFSWKNSAQKIIEVLEQINA